MNISYLMLLILRGASRSKSNPLQKSTFKGVRKIKLSKKTTRCILLIVLLIISSFAISGCQKPKQENAEAIITFQLSPSTDDVDDFLTLLGEYESGYESDICYNVTPKEIQEKYSFKIFKFDTSCNSFLECEGKIYPLGTGFGGLGATSFAITDLNGDSAVELYFTYSSGSGLHRSQAGYFDTASGEMSELDFIHYNNDSVLGADGQTLCLYDAQCNIRSFVDIELSAGEKLASISCESGKITAVGIETAGTANAL